VVRLVLAVVLAAVLSACGSPPCSESCAALRPLPSPHLDPGFDVLVTEHDRAVSVHVGQKIEVYLLQRQGMTAWQNLVADDSSVLQPANTGIVPPPRGSTVAGFVALRTGTANITATAGPLCSPGQACPMYEMLFDVRVTVS
jgi:hypothetical protein